MTPNQNNSRLSKQVIETATDFKCENCEHICFVPVFFIKKISALASPTGEEITFPVQSFACAKCDHVNKDFLPKVAV